MGSSEWPPQLRDREGHQCTEKGPTSGESGESKVVTAGAPVPLLSFVHN